jgi:hypothetical protein
MLTHQIFGSPEPSCRSFTMLWTYCGHHWKRTSHCRCRSTQYHHHVLVMKSHHCPCNVVFSKRHRNATQLPPHLVSRHPCRMESVATTSNLEALIPIVEATSGSSFLLSQLHMTKISSNWYMLIPIRNNLFICRR